MSESFYAHKKTRYLIMVYDALETVSILSDFPLLRNMQRRRCKGLAEIFNMLREPGGRLFVPVRRTDDLCRLRSVFSSTALAHSARHKVQELRCQIKTQNDVVIFCTDRRLYCSTLNYSSLFIITCFVLKNGRHVSAKEYHGVNLAIDFFGRNIHLWSNSFRRGLDS